MKSFSKLGLVLILGVFLSVGLFAQQNTMTAGEFTLKWNIDGENLVMTVSAKTTGWVSVGFEPSKVMKDADILIFSVDKDGTVKGEDEYGVSLFGHKKDTEIGGTDNLTIISGSEKNGMTTVKFSIPLSSGDSKDKVLVAGQKVKVLFASGKKDKFSAKHNKKAKGEITL